MNTTTDLLTAFAGYIKDPIWHSGNRTFAGDRACVVGVPRIDAEFPVVTSRVQDDWLQPSGEWRPWCLVEAGSFPCSVGCGCVPRKCDECEGEGYLTCDLNHEHGCDECGGWGEIYCGKCDGGRVEVESKLWDFDELQVQDRYVQLIQTHLGECEWAPSQGLPGSVLFRAGDVFALVMEVEQE